MPITPADIKWRLSGGASNNNPATSLGGLISSVEIVDAVDQNLFDDVIAPEAAAGDVEYRGFYILNDHATLTLVDVRIFVLSPTSSPATELDIAIAVEAPNVAMATIANESAAPAGGVTFARPADYANGIRLNGATGLAPKAYKGVWVRRTVTGGGTAQHDAATIAVEGETAI